MSNIAVFGGTFNPFHIGHYEILKALCENELFDQVLLMPANIPPHKEFRATISDRDRINICKIACLDFPKAEVTTIEFEREEKSYTYDTVLLLKQEYPDAEIYITCGADMIETLDTWHRFDDLKHLVKFVAFNRGKDKRFLNNVKKMRQMGANILIMDNIITDVSSTQLRNNPNEKLFPKNILNYLRNRGIYNGN